MTHSADTTRRPRQDRVANRARLIDAYVALVDSGGTDLRVEAVAKAAGVGRATAYRHMRDEQALRVAVYRRAVDTVVAAVVSEAAEPLEAHLRAIAEAGLSATERYALNNIPRPLTDHGLERAIDGLLARLSRRLAAEQSAGRLAEDVPTALLAELFISLVESVGREEPLPDGAGLVVRLFLGAAAPAPSGASGRDPQAG